MIKDFTINSRYILVGMESNYPELAGKDYIFKSYSKYENTLEFKLDDGKQKITNKDAHQIFQDYIDGFYYDGSTYLPKDDQDKTWKAYEVI